MQKEDLLKRMKLVVTLTTLGFVVLVVVLLIQFGFIARRHTEIKRLQDTNAEIREQLEGLERELEYIKGEYEKDASMRQ